ncbi:MAG: hypothetical protein WC464_03175 [Bdellovibrionales bacterium]
MGTPFGFSFAFFLVMPAKAGIPFGFFVSQTIKLFGQVIEDGKKPMHSKNIILLRPYFRQAAFLSI